MPPCSVSQDLKACIPVLHYLQSKKSVEYLGLRKALSTKPSCTIITMASLIIHMLAGRQAGVVLTLPAYLLSEQYCRRITLSTSTRSRNNSVHDKMFMSLFQPDSYSLTHPFYQQRRIRACLGTQ
jgi:hypothetical protein